MTKRIRSSLRPILFLLTSFLLVVFGMTKAIAYTNTVTNLKVGICFESNGSDVEDVILLNEIGKGLISDTSIPLGSSSRFRTPDGIQSLYTYLFLPAAILL